jgi:hypothetical protein
MKLYVPEIGDHIKLTADWSFDLFNEHRNKSLWELYDCDNDPAIIIQRTEQEKIRAEIEVLEARMYPNNIRWNRAVGFHNHPVNPEDITKRYELFDKLHKLLVVNVTIPAESVLSIDRIFIRKGMDDYSSLTFFLKSHPNKTFKKKPRFWAKLHDCNKIEFEPHIS